MHIPDGFLDPLWCAATYALTLAYFAYAYRRVKSLYDPSASIPLVTVLSAAIFVAQMLNWPLPGGTSLHFVGSALSSIVLGPYLASFAMLLVLAVQTLVFHDGGITTLGANVLNMGIVAVWTGYGVFKLASAALKSISERRSKLVGAFVSGWLSIVVAGVAAGLEIGLSPSFPYGVLISVPVMASWHAALGIVEGAITALTVEYLSSKHPEAFLAEGGAR